MKHIFPCTMNRYWKGLHFLFGDTEAHGRGGTSTYCTVISVLCTRRFNIRTEVGWQTGRHLNCVQAISGEYSTSL